MHVSQWMSGRPVCVTPDDHLDSVDTAMKQGGFRQAPVVDTEGRLIGIVTNRDVREHKGYLETTKVSAAMSEPAIAVEPGDPIEHAVQLLIDRKIGAVPVIDRERRVIGMVSATDLLRGFLDSIGSGPGAVRIDLGASPSDGFADIVRTIEASGAVLVGLGTGPAGFFVRVAAGDAERARAALRGAGFSVPA